ncbi:MAG: hypothetical protein MH252_04555 [Thermosynechococcaceae cyanobacterium MS004]|nr:hypothetical protein [Thermosynechococcaceae cyanobacterium MS004]
MTHPERQNPIIPQYDRHIIPAENAARAAREGSGFHHVVHDDPLDKEHIHTRDGYTVDQDGLVNNYAVEPEMYFNTPGDHAEQQALEDAERAHELAQLSESEEGLLTDKHDFRHKGSGLI